MGLLFRLCLIALFALGVYALELRHPEALEKPEAVAALVALGLILLASLFEGRRRGGAVQTMAERPGAHDDRLVEPSSGRSAGAFGDRIEAPAQARLMETSRSADRRSAEAAGRRFAQASGLSFSGPRPFRRGALAVRSAVVSLSVWVCVVAVLVVAYGHRIHLKESALLALSALQPGAPIALTQDEAVLTRDRGGHFTTIVRINEQNVRMLVDTGSSDVALPYEEAERLGVDMRALSFTRAVMTANGQAMVAPVTLPTVTVGPISLRNVAASVAEPGRLGSPLLGMSFLGGLSEVSIRGDELRLRR